MVPPLGKITSFFKPYVIKKKDGAAEQFDGDNITVVNARALPTEQLQRAVSPQLKSLQRSISPRRSSQKSTRTQNSSRSSSALDAKKRTARPTPVHNRSGQRSIRTADKVDVHSTSTSSRSDEDFTSAARRSKERSTPRESRAEGRSTPRVRTPNGQPVPVGSQSEGHSALAEREPDGWSTPMQSRLDEQSTPIGCKPDAPVESRLDERTTPTERRLDEPSMPTRSGSDRRSTPTTSRLLERFTLGANNLQAQATPTRSEAQLTSEAARSEAQPTPTAVRSAARTSPELRDQQLNDHESPLSMVSRSPSTLLSVRTIKGNQQPDIVMDNPVPPIVLKPTSEDPVLSSFSSTSSRCVIVNGIKAVTNSDSDSISSSSDDGLEDLASFMPRKRMKMTPPGQDSAHAIVLHDDDERTLVKHTRSIRKPVAPVRKKYRHSLANLVKQVEKDEATTARIKQAEADIEEHQGLKANGDTDGDGSKPEVNLFADDSDQERIKAAIDRVEALEDSDLFYFFSESGLADEHAPWPVWETLAPLLQTEAGREISIRSSFLTNLAMKIDLPRDVLSWIYRSLQVEPSGVLCEEYLSILQAASRHNPASRLRDFSLRKVYHGMTNNNEQLKPARIATASDLPRNLRYNLRLLCTLVEGMSSSEERAIVLVDLFLLNLDEHVRNSLDIQLEIERAIRAVFETSHRENDDSIVPLAVGQILNYDVLSKRQMARGIAVLPATTTALHRFRRQLALHYMLTTSSYNPVNTTSLETGDQLLKVLKNSPLLLVTNETSWTMFHWTVHLLDISVDAGFSDFKFMNADPKSKVEEQSERDFNRQVDEISQRLRVIANSIQDAGTSHLRRIEAKTALERLVARIELSVRTQPKQKDAVFGGKVGVGQRDLFTNFLARAESDNEDEAFETLLRPAKNIHGRKSVKFEHKDDLLGREVDGIK